MQWPYLGETATMKILFPYRGLRHTSWGTHCMLVHRTVRNLIRAGNLIRAALFPQKVGGSTKNRTLFKLVRSFH
jgi:hypothetical protein